MNAIKITFCFATFLSIFLSSTAAGGTVTIPNSFSSGSATSASQMNANFTAVKTAVDDNNARIVAIEASSNPVFQGFSTSTMNGGGLIAMQQACSASFSGSKICSTTEFAHSTYNSNASNLSGTAWILSDYIANNGKGMDKNFGYMPDPENFTCRGWTSGTTGAGEGTTIDSLGKIAEGSCGGGGGSSAPSSVQHSNRAPTSISLSSSSLLEGSKGTTVGTLSTADLDGASFNYTISGDDASSFRVSAILCS